jgi:hypothetical protein
MLARVSAQDIKAHVRGRFVITRNVTTLRTSKFIALSLGLNEEQESKLKQKGKNKRTKPNGKSTR